MTALGGSHWNLFAHCPSMRSIEASRGSAGMPPQEIFENYMLKYAIFMPFYYIVLVI